MNATLKKIERGIKDPRRAAIFFYVLAKRRMGERRVAAATKKDLNYFFEGSKAIDLFLKRRSKFGDFWLEYYKQNPDDKEFLQEADLLAKHIVDLLGSGKTNLGQKIDWLKDFKTGKKWPLSRPASLRFGEGDGSDIKVPWELSRFYHAPILARACVLSGDQRYAEELIRQIEDWLDSNPLCLGPNWMNAMEVAIRICNLSLAYEILKSWEAEKKVVVVSKGFTEKFLHLVIEHGIFIAANLENVGVKSNHLIADLAGLVYLGTIYPEIKYAKKWQKTGINLLKVEISRQVDEEGVDYEASISYHRLVTEMLGHIGLLAKIYDLELDEKYFSTLSKMFGFVGSYTRPDGLAPIIGDDDSGRLHLVFDRYFNRDSRDHEHLFKLQKLIGNLPELGKSGSVAFKRSGRYFIKSPKQYVAVSAGVVGQGGSGGHAHNDVFGCEYTYDGEVFLVDSGTYTYTAYPEERNVFRSTAMHNTVVIDEREQNEIVSSAIFYLHDQARPKLIEWKTSNEADVLVVEHYGYRKLKQSVTHRRRFELDKKAESLRVEDFFVGRGEHKLEWNWHFAPEVNVFKAKESANGLGFEAVKDDKKIAISFSTPSSASLDWEIKSGYISPGYGIKTEAPMLKIKTKTDVPEKPFITEITGVSVK